MHLLWEKCIFCGKKEENPLYFFDVAMEKRCHGRRWSFLPVLKHKWILDFSFTLIDLFLFSMSVPFFLLLSPRFYFLPSFFGTLPSHRLHSAFLIRTHERTHCQCCILKTIGFFHSESPFRHFCFVFQSRGICVPVCCLRTFSLQFSLLPSLAWTLMMSHSLATAPPLTNEWLFLK